MGSVDTLLAEHVSFRLTCEDCVAIGGVDRDDNGALSTVHLRLLWNAAHHGAADH